MKSNVVKITTDQIKIYVKFESEWNKVTSSVARKIIALTKCVLRGIFETRERERQNVTLREWHVDSRLCYGDWITGGKEREGKGREGRVVGILWDIYWKNLDEESEGKIILKFILLFKDLKRNINKIPCDCLKHTNPVHSLTP